MLDRSSSKFTSEKPVIDNSSNGGLLLHKGAYSLPPQEVDYGLVKETIYNNDLVSAEEDKKESVSMCQIFPSAEKKEVASTKAAPETESEDLQSELGEKLVNWAQSRTTEQWIRYGLLTTGLLFITRRQKKYE